MAQIQLWIGTGEAPWPVLLSDAELAGLMVEGAKHFQRKAEDEDA